MIGAPPFLRLQEVKQLGFVYRIWPGAVHTRFEHSLGVYHLALKALRVLWVRGDAAAAGVSGADLRVVWLAALLHDVGHYPFSHAIEEIGGAVMPHEKVGRQVIEREPLAGILEREAGVSPGDVADLIDPPPTGLPPARALLRGLLSGALDVDKLDYLPRDARACNVPYAGVDVARLMDALRVVSTSAGYRLAVTEKGVSALHSMVHARQEMFDNVYWHHTNRAMMAMLLRAVQDALLAGALRPEALCGHDDHSLLVTLAAPRMPSSSRALAAALSARRPHRGVLEVSVRAGGLWCRLDALFADQGRRRAVEAALAGGLARALGRPVATHEVLIDIPKPEKWQMDVLVRFGEPPLGLEPVMSWSDVTGQQAADLAKYERHQRRIRVVAGDALAVELRAKREVLLVPALQAALQACGA